MRLNEYPVTLPLLGVLALQPSLILRSPFIYAFCWLFFVRYICCDLLGVLAQLAERRAYDAEVKGSKPLRSILLFGWNDIFYFLLQDLRI